MAKDTPAAGTAVPSTDGEEQAVEAAVEKAVEQAMAVPGQTAPGPAPAAATTAADKTPAAPAPPTAVAGLAVYRAGDYHGLQGAAVRLGVRASVVVGAMAHAGLSEATLQQLRTAVETFLAAPVR